MYPQMVHNMTKSLHGYEHVFKFYKDNGPLDGCCAV